MQLLDFNPWWKSSQVPKELVGLPREMLPQVLAFMDYRQIILLFGMRRAGKTTLMHIVANLSKPTAGDVFIGGYRLADAASQLRRFIGLVSHKTLLYDDLTADQNLRFYARLYDLPDAPARMASKSHSSSS